MTISTINNIVSSGLLASRPATPALATPASGSNPSVFYLATDTGDTYAWDFVGAAWVQVNTGGGGGGSYTSIATVTTTSGQTTLTFTPGSSYRHLKIIGWGNTTGSGDDPIKMQFNSDATSGHYSDTLLFANTALGGGIFVNTETTNTYLNATIFGGTPSGSVPGQFELTIPNYNSTLFDKSYTSVAGYNDVRGPLTIQITGYWNSTAAITSITLFSATAFVTGSVFEIFGLA